MFVFLRLQCRPIARRRARERGREIALHWYLHFQFDMFVLCLRYNWMKVNASACAHTHICCAPLQNVCVCVCVVYAKCNFVEVKYSEWSSVCGHETIAPGWVQSALNSLEVKRAKATDLSATVCVYATISCVWVHFLKFHCVCTSTTYVTKCACTQRCLAAAAAVAK